RESAQPVRASGAGVGARLMVSPSTATPLTVEVSLADVLLFGLSGWWALTVTVSTLAPAAALGTYPVALKSQVTLAPGARVTPTTCAAHVGAIAVAPGQ